jgi:hypothetical protein
MEFESYYSIWYWILLTSVWTVVCYHTLGVSYGMILRAQRSPIVAAEVDSVALMISFRLGWIRRRLGMPLAAIAGFGLAALAVIGFVAKIEFAQALFMLLFPLSLVAAATLALSRDIVEKKPQGEVLRAMLSRRRRWNQVIAIVTLLATAVAALINDPRFIPI